MADNFDINTQILVTADPIDDQDAAMLDTIFQQFQKSSTQPATLWDKYAPKQGVQPSPENEARKSVLIKAFTQRRLNSVGGICPEDTLPDGLKALVIWPRQKIHHKEKLRKDADWSAVTDDGQLISGKYQPGKAVLPFTEAFAEMAQAYQNNDTSVMVRTELNDISLDGWQNHKDWKQIGADNTEHHLKNSFYAEMGSDDNEATSKLLSQVTKATANSFKSKETATFWACQRALEAQMDKTALKHARMARKPRGIHYNWQMGAALVPVDQNAMERARSKPPKPESADPVLKERRQQAVGLFPLLARVWMADNDKAPRMVLETIDNGRELVPALARHHKVTPRHIKSIRGLTWQKTGGRDVAQNPTGFLKALPLDHMPKNRQEWRAMRRVFSFAKDISRMKSALGDTHHMQSRHIFNNDTPHETQWPGENKSVWANIAPRYAAFDKALGPYTPGGTHDFMRHMTEKLIAPILKNHLLENGQAKGFDITSIKDVEHVFERQETALLDTQEHMTHVYTPRRLAEAQNRWHTNLATINAQTQDPSMPRSDVSWTPVLGEGDLPKGLTFKEINSQSGMTWQGLRENHCVAGYTDHVLSNGQTNEDCLIFSLERQTEKGTQIISTVEFGVEHSHPNRKVSINQNYGYGNSTPHESATTGARTLQRMLKTCSKEKFQDHHTSVAQANAERHKTQTITNWNGKEEQVPTSWVKSGYDPRDENMREKTFQAYASMLPKALSKDFKAFEKFVVDTYNKAQEKAKTRPSSKCEEIFDF